jgi:hypothetical protein
LASSGRILLLPVLLEACGDSLASCTFWRHFSGDNFLGRRLPSFFVFLSFGSFLVDCCMLHCPSFASVWLDVFWVFFFYIPFFCSVSTFDYAIYGIVGGCWPADIDTLSTLAHFSLSHPCRLTHFMGSGIHLLHFPPHTAPFLDLTI